MHCVVVGSLCIHGIGICMTPIGIGCVCFCMCIDYMSLDVLTYIPNIEINLRVLYIVGFDKWLSTVIVI